MKSHMGFYFLNWLFCKGKIDSIPKWNTFYKLPKYVYIIQLITFLKISTIKVDKKKLWFIIKLKIITSQLVNLCALKNLKSTIRKLHEKIKRQVFCFVEITTRDKRIISTFISPKIFLDLNNFESL